MLTIMLLLLSFSSVSSVLNQLSFSGGGSFGAVEIGIIKKLMEKKGKERKEKKTQRLWCMSVCVYMHIYNI